MVPKVVAMVRLPSSSATYMASAAIGLAIGPVGPVLLAAEVGLVCMRKVCRRPVGQCFEFVSHVSIPYMCIYDHICMQSFKESRPRHTHLGLHLTTCFFFHMFIFLYDKLQLIDFPLLVVGPSMGHHRVMWRSEAISSAQLDDFICATTWAWHTGHMVLAGSSVIRLSYFTLGQEYLQMQVEHPAAYASKSYLLL